MAVPKRKRCRIVRGENYRLTMYVDGQEIKLSSLSAANYFHVHYQKLGYMVTFKDYTEK
jgi:hypothetical protein